MKHRIVIGGFVACTLFYSGACSEGLILPTVTTVERIGRSHLSAPEDSPGPQEDMPEYAEIITTDARIAYGSYVPARPPVKTVAGGTMDFFGDMGSIEIEIQFVDKGSGALVYGPVSHEVANGAGELLNCPDVFFGKCRKHLRYGERVSQAWLGKQLHANHFIDERLSDNARSGRRCCDSLRPLRRSHRPWWPTSVHSSGTGLARRELPHRWRRTVLGVRPVQKLPHNHGREGDSRHVVDMVAVSHRRLSDAMLRDFR